MTVDNDATLAALEKIATSHARAGADMVAPSGMIDGMVGTIRSALDEAGFEHVPIMSYAAKYESAFYGPFRDAADGAPAFGNRRHYQMDPANAREAVREVRLDAEQGADVMMVKPALPYLDIISTVRSEFDHPVAAYNVSGEYAMLQAAAEKAGSKSRRSPRNRCCRSSGRCGYHRDVLRRRRCTAAVTTVSTAADSLV